MIIITGPGRSGTSLVAGIYRELGFDPGGNWNDSINAGLEAGDVVRVNNAIVKDLGLGTLGPPQEGAQPPEMLSQVWKRVVPRQFHERLRASLHLLPFVASRGPGFLRWERIDDIAGAHRERLQEIAGSYEVVKDPRFCWTLGVWAAAGVPIDHVLVCTRSLEAMAGSRSSAGHYRGWTDAEIKDSLVYGLGLCMAALSDHQLPYSVIRFPDFLRDPLQLYADMQFPREVAEEAFLRVVREVGDPDLVHDRR